MRILLAAALLILTQTLSLPANAEEQVATAVSTPQHLPKWTKDNPDFIKICSFPEYPEQARRYGMQGKTRLKLQIDESGKVSALELLRSSGWKALDMIVMRTLANCQVAPAGHWIPEERFLTLDWQFDKGYVSPAVIDAKSCKPSETLRFADDNDSGVGIVVGIYTSTTGKVLDAKIQWGSDNEQLDQESLRIARSCEFWPAENKGKRIGVAGSLRFVEKARQQ